MNKFQVGEIVYLTDADTLWIVLGYENKEGGELMVRVARDLGFMYQENTYFESRFQKFKFDGKKIVFDTPEKGIECLKEFSY